MLDLVGLEYQKNGDGRNYTCIITNGERFIMGSIVSSIFGGGSQSQAPAPSPSGGGQSFTTSVIREAPGIEETKN